MSRAFMKSQRQLLTAVAAAATIVASLAPISPAMAQRTTGKVRTMARVADLPPGTQRPASEISLSIGQGQLVSLPANAANVWVSNPTAADVYVNNPRQIYVFGKEFGEATVYATSASGAVLYATNIYVAQNSTSVDRMIRLAMPDADIKVTMAGQLAVLTGTVATPDDAEQAERIVLAALNPGVDINAANATLKIGVVSRLKAATPLQVNLQVKIAEVNRSFAKEIGVNLLSRDSTGGFNFGVAQGRSFGSIGNANISSLPLLDASSVFGLPAGSISLPFDPRIGQFVTRGGTVFDFTNLGQGAGKTAFGLAGRLLGVDISTALDLAETSGLLTTLAQPNLTALSGETASFLAGGEIPIPKAATLGAVEIEYKPYGVSLAFTPIVLSDGRISMRVRPEVSELSNEGAIRINGFDVPGISTRRAETTIELGSGQSFMIGGLMRSLTANTITKAPGAGDLPILGALFRSNSFRRNDTELMIIVTPYLVKPVSADQIKLPTDGYLAPTDAERLLLGKTFEGKTGQQRPVPTSAPDTTIVRPQVGVVAPPLVPPAPVKGGKKATASGSGSIRPGFSN